MDILAINPVPKILFATGDLVLGYGDDKGEEVRAQLDAWIAEYQNSPIRGKITLVPMPGNHEMNIKKGDNRMERLHTSAVWNDWVKTNHLMPTKPNGPSAAGEDELTDDQSTLNFSFDSDKVHFVCLNTDARTKDGRIGYIPAHWAKSDIERAHKAGKTIFVLGHRNVVNGIIAKADAPIEPKSGGELVKAIQSSPNVMAYLCAHVHAWDVSKVGGTRPWQIIAGNGGSKLEKDWKPESGRTYGFAVIEIHRSGTVTLVPYFLPANDKNPAVPAQPAMPIILGKIAK